MPTPETWLAGAVLGSLIVYALSGGADFGGGVWDLLAFGPRGEAQRATIAHAIAPIWEANHVWLILVVVVLFTGFPFAFAALTTALHVPLTAALIGIVLRGSAFAFRSQDEPSEVVRRRWSRTFAIASTVTPWALGLCVGAAASGSIRVDPASGRVQTDFVSDWLAPFPIALGFLTLALFTFLAAVYLTLETEDVALRRDFRRRALAAAIVSGVLAGACLVLARTGAPHLWEGLTARAWSLPFHLATALAALGALAALWTERYRLARPLAMLQVALVVAGWGLAQYPSIVHPDLTIENAAAPRRVIELTLAGLGAGGAVLVPSMIALFRIFKGGRSR